MPRLEPTADRFGPDRLAIGSLDARELSYRGTSSPFGTLPSVLKAPVLPSFAIMIDEFTSSDHSFTIRAMDGASCIASGDGSVATMEAGIHVATEVFVDKQSVLKLTGTASPLIRIGCTEVKSRLCETVHGRVAAEEFKWVVCAGDWKCIDEGSESTLCEYDSNLDVTCFTFIVNRLNNVGQTDTLKAYYEVSLRRTSTSHFGEEIHKVWLDLSTQKQEPEVVSLDFQGFALEQALHPLLPGHGTPLPDDKSCVLSEATIFAAAASGVSSGSGQQARSLCKDECFLSQTSTIQAPLATLLDTLSSQLVLAWTAGVRTPVQKGVAPALSMADRPCITLRPPRADNGLEFAAATSLLHFTARHSSLVPGIRYKLFLTGNRVWTKSWVVDAGQTGVADVSEGDRQYLACQKDTMDILQLIQQRSSFKHGVVSLDMSVLVGADGNFTADIDLSPDKGPPMDVRRQKAGLLALLCASAAGVQGAKGASASLVPILVPESSAHPVVAICLPTIRVAEKPTSPASSEASNSPRTEGSRGMRARGASSLATAGSKRSSSDASSSDGDVLDAPSSAPPAKKVKKTGARSSAAAPVASAASTQPPSPALSGASSSVRSTKGGRGKGASSPSTLAGGSSSSSTGSRDCFALGTSASTAPSASTHQPARSGKAVQAKKPAASQRTSSRASADAGGSLPAAPVNLGKHHPGPYPVLSDGTTPALLPLYTGIIPQLGDSWSEEDVLEAATGLELDLASPMESE